MDEQKIRTDYADVLRLRSHGVEKPPSCKELRQGEGCESRQTSWQDLFRDAKDPLGVEGLSLRNRDEMLAEKNNHKGREHD